MRGYFEIVRKNCLDMSIKSIMLHMVNHIVANLKRNLFEIFRKNQTELNESFEESMEIEHLRKETQARKNVGSWCNISNPIFISIFTVKSFRHWKKQVPWLLRFQIQRICMQAHRRALLRIPLTWRRQNRIADSSEISQFVICYGCCYCFCRTGISQF